MTTTVNPQCDYEIPDHCDFSHGGKTFPFNLERKPAKAKSAAETPRRGVPTDELLARQAADIARVMGSQESMTGAVAEYGQIEETIAPIALETMSKWILKHTGK